MSLRLDVRGRRDEGAEHWAHNSPTLGHHLALEILGVSSPHLVKDYECCVLRALPLVLLSDLREVAYDVLLAQVSHGYLEEVALMYGGSTLE